MIILHLLSQNQLTGAEVYATELINQQTASGHVVYQVSNGFFKFSSAIRIQFDVETTSLFKFIKSVVQFRKLLKEKNIQVIHSHSRAASKLAHYARFGLKIGYVSTIHGRQHVSISKKLNNIYGDFLIPICKNISDQLTNEFRYKARRIRTLGNGFDFQKFNFQKYTAKSDLKDRSLLIAIVGRDSGPKKIRTEIFISEFSKILENQNIHYQFHIVGGQKNNFSIQNTNVVYLSNDVEINSNFYHQFDLVCGSGRVCIEAVLSGVPVIAFGESLYCGLVTTDNYAQFKQSNFGDIGQNFNLPEFNTQIAKSDLNYFLNIDLKGLSDLACADFDLKTVNQKIERIYQSSYFLRQYSKWIPILMYHKIPDTDLQGPHKIFVTKNNFEKHLKFFRCFGFTTLTFSDLSDYRKGIKKFSDFPKKPLILTFDDGYLDNILNADPLLKKYDFKAQIFLLAEPDIASNTWDQTDLNSVSTKQSEKHELVSGSERKKWIGSNFEIGSHGIKHQKMPEMNSKQKMFELVESKKMLFHEFQKNINVFAFTYGLTNSECAEACENAGYDYGLNTDTGGLLIEENPYSIFRVNIFPNESLLSLFKKTSTWYRMYYYIKRGV